MSRHPRSSERRRFHIFTAHPYFWIITGIVVAFGAWTAWSLLDLRSTSQAMMAHAGRAKAALAVYDSKTAGAEVASAIALSTDARDQAHSAPLSWVAVIPGVGRPVDMLQGMTSVADDTLTDVVQPLIAMNLNEVFTGAPGSPGVDLDAIRAATPTVQNVARTANVLAEQAEAIPTMSYLPTLDDARATLASESTGLAHTLDALASVAPSLPGLLGGDGDRTYLMVFQTNAEARGTGGLLGGTAVLRVRNGAITIDQAAPNSDLRPVTQRTDLGPDFQTMYGQWSPDTEAKNANFSPHFPYAGTLWSEIWRQNHGSKLDGVIATDPVALSYLLAATGPVEIPGGEKIHAENVVPLTLNELYFRYPDPTDQLVRKNYLQSISRTVIETITSSRAPKASVLKALGRAAGEERLMIWSAVPSEQAALEATPLGHAVPEGPAPYANVVLNNGAGGKLDYYLDREISYRAGACDGAMRSSTITLKLTNTAPLHAEYPPYLHGRLSRETQYGGPPGTNRTVVSIFTTEGSKFEEITVNGMPGIASRSNERGHPVYNTVVTTKPESTTEIVLTLKEPTAEGAAEIPVQPLARNAKVEVAVPAC